MTRKIIISKKVFLIILYFKLSCFEIDKNKIKAFREISKGEQRFFLFLRNAYNFSIYFKDIRRQNAFYVSL